MEFVAREFGAVTVDLDGNSFVKCRFLRSTLRYSGLATVDFQACSFDGVSWHFDGAAGQTVAFMKALAGDPGLAHIIADTFPTLATRP